MEMISVPGNIPGKLTEIKFKIYPRLNCVYSQVSPAHTATSSINIAERIILTISERKGWNPSNVRFFDFQSSIAYRNRERTDLGMYEFDELVFNARRETSWHPVKCPDFVERDFAIPGTTPSQILRFKPSRTF